jgi:hypothetical protein
LTDFAVPALVQLNETPLLTTYLKVWDDYATFVGFIKRIYSILDSHQNTRGLKPLSGAALELFNEILYSSVREKLCKEILIIFIRERDGEVVDKKLMKEVIQCYVMQGLVGAEPKRESSKYFWEGWKSLNFYEGEFEVHFLYYASLEYQEKAKLWLANFTVPIYLQKVVASFEHEE